MEGFEVKAKDTPAMSVAVTPGVVGIPAGSSPSHFRYWGFNDTSTGNPAGESVTIPTADVSNDRIDVIVAYIDLGETPDDEVTNNTNGVLKLACVAGTPAGSPTAPNAGAIQSAIGGGNPYVILAEVEVGANTPNITNPDITDVRTMMTLTAGRVPAGDITATEIDFSEMPQAGAGSSAVGTNQTTTSTSFADLATVQSFDVDVGPSGVLIVGLSATVSNSGIHGQCRGSFALSGANTLAADTSRQGMYQAYANNAGGGIAASFCLTGLNPGLTTVTMKFSVSGGTGSFSGRNIWAVPL